MFIGILEDNLNLLISSYTQNTYNGSEPLFFYTYYFFSSFINSIHLYNIVLFISLILNIFVSYKFFKLFFTINLSRLLSILFVFSPYFYYQGRSHLVLFQVWILVLYLYYFIRLYFFTRTIKYKNYLFLGFIIAILSLTSNYLGFIGLLFTFIFFVLELSYSLIFKKYFSLKILANYICIFLTFSIIFLTFNFKLVHLNYFQPHEENSISNDLVIKRPIEDFIIFSNRPWYNILPSIDNPFFGSVTSNAMKYLNNNYSSYLLDNYFKSEHSANYLGLTNLLLSFVGFISLIKYQKKHYYFTSGKVKKSKLYMIIVSLFVTYLFTFPPYITISGLYIYLPSSLISSNLPMFRVLSRISILILLLLLIFTGIGYKVIYNKLFTAVNSKILVNIFVVIIFVLSLLEFFIPLRFTSISNTPSIYKYISKNTNVSDKLFVYPHNKLIEATFWNKNYNRVLVNNSNSSHLIHNQLYSNTKITNNLINCEGLYTALKLDFDYLIYFNNKSSSEELLFLEKNLKKVYSTPLNFNTNHFQNKFYKISYLGDNNTNNAILFKVPSDLVNKKCIN